MKQRVIITMFETTQFIAIVEEKDFQRQLDNCEVNDVFIPSFDKNSLSTLPLELHLKQLYNNGSAGSSLHLI